MKIVTRDLGVSPKDIRIEVFGDLHIGSKKCDLAQITDRINAVASDPNTYAIVLGDIINNSTKTSVGDVYEEALSPMDQIKTAVELFRPIKDKILCGVSGNHERRSYRTDGLDLLHFMFAELDIADVYDYASCLLFIKCGKASASHHSRCSHNARNLGQLTYTVYCTHGDGNGGKTVGGKANGLAKRGDIVDADVIITGHTHQAIVFTQAAYKIDKRNSTVYEHTQLFVNIGSTLKYEEYAELYGMRPSAPGSPRITLSGTTFKATAVL